MNKIVEIREAAEASLETFIRLVHPQRLLAHCHQEVISWWTREDASTHQLLLYPRDHGKSAMIAYRVAWEITKDPTLRVLYISSTANLAEKQLKFIKDIFESRIYQRYWPDMIHKDEGKREKWTTSEISVDHPRRKAEAVRDPTIFTGGLTTGLTGLHCDIAVLDDIVVHENAYTEEGREKVKRQYSLLASIAGTDARNWVVGTRYHPLDLFNDLLEMEIDDYDENGEVIGTTPVYEIMEKPVEDLGDGSGVFLWPRQQRGDGKWFGFDRRILNTKRAQYLDKTQFRAQYYNNPNDLESAPIQRDYFQYYNRGLIQRSNGSVYYGNARLNVVAAVDFATSLRKKADYTAITVLGIDPDSNYYILDIDRFKTEKIKEYFDRILALHNKWGFRKIRADATSTQKMIVTELRDQYIRKNGLALAIDEYKANRHQGTKEERIQAVLNPRYENRSVYHFKGGNCELLEEELVLQNPPHDDLKDSLSSAMEIAVAPTGYAQLSKASPWEGLINSRFGGVA